MRKRSQQVHSSFSPLYWLCFDLGTWIFRLSLCNLQVRCPCNSFFHCHTMHTGKEPRSHILPSL